MDSCIFLGSDSGYSASKDDHVHLEEEDEAPSMDSSRESINDLPSQDTAADRSTEIIIELQVKHCFYFSFLFVYVNTFYLITLL